MVFVKSIFESDGPVQQLFQAVSFPISAHTLNSNVNPNKYEKCPKMNRLNRDLVTRTIQKEASMIEAGFGARWTITV